MCPIKIVFVANNVVLQKNVPSLKANEEMGFIYKLYRYGIKSAVLLVKTCKYVKQL